MLTYNNLKNKVADVLASAGFIDSNQTVALINQDKQMIWHGEVKKADSGLVSFLFTQVLYSPDNKNQLVLVARSDVKKLEQPCLFDESFVAVQGLDYTPVDTDLVKQLVENITMLQFASDTDVILG